MRSKVIKIKNHLAAMWALARALPAFYRGRPTLARSEEEVRMGALGRGETFLAVACERIYGDPASPYLRLLRGAGWSFADLSAAVCSAGLEATLERLAADGVYLTAEEYRGKKEVVRGGGAPFRVSPEDFQRRDGAPGILIQTGGTTGAPLGATASLARLAFSVRPLMVFFAAHDLFAASHGLNDSMLPGSGGTCCLLIYTKIGVVPKRWFARAIPNSSRSGAFYHWLTTRMIILLGRLYGPGFPGPEFLDTKAIVKWIVLETARGGRCCVTASSSNALRIAAVAGEMGVSLVGTKFIATGEPLTEAKRGAIESAGAAVTCRYAFTELGMAAYGCGRPKFTDEVHVLQNFATIVRHPALPGSPVRPLLFTTIDPSADRLLLNVANGDCGVLEKRDCGCALEKAGLTLHLHHIRSYEKFTGEGMNYFYADIVEVLEKVFPAEFGGGPEDYQLVEDEDANGQTRLTLRVDPRVGALDREKLLARLRAELSRGVWGNEFQTRIWDGAGTLRVTREAPLDGAREKVLPLQIQPPDASRR